MSESRIILKGIIDHRQGFQYNVSCIVLLVTLPITGEEIEEKIRNRASHPDS